MSFVGLHIHSDYSLLDGASQLPELVEQAVQLGMPAIALTDHGVMYGAIELIKVCRGKGIKPIIGNEMYVINGDPEKQERRPRYHQVVLAKNTQGYKNLVKLTTISHLKGMQGKGIFSRPCINKELLAQYHEGLIVTSACLGGEVPQAILQGKPEIARRVAQWYKELFGEDYYLEIQDHGSLEDRMVNIEIIKIARELDIKVIATNDSHFISCFDVEAHDALLCIQTGKLIAEDKRLRYSGTEYLKSAQEMAQLFRDHLPEDVIQTAIATTLEVADKIEPYQILGEPRIPNYPVPADHTADTYLEQVTWQGLLERLKLQSRTEVDATYRQRLDYELKMMQQMGFSTYFLVVWDYIKYARDNGIPVGPGRGSAAGSLVAYALKITNIDPVHHGLLFERFLNPERKSMPDIDTDFCIEKRDRVIEYVTQKYGADRVAQIITFNRMTSKAVLKDVARVLDIPYGEADRMAKLIPVSRGKPAKLKVMISEQTPAPEFKEKYDKDPKVRHWLDMAMRIEGTNKTFGVHAAGVVIAAQPLDEIVPLQRNNDGSVITQYFMEDLEMLGLLKMDFLGLRNLTMIQKTVDLIKQTRNFVLDADQIPMDDLNTFQLLGRGQLEGIFQLESSGMRQVVRDLKPSNLEDISSILALYRPGPLDAGLIPKFIDRKHGREKVDYPHPLLEPILEETYGTLCLPRGTLINKSDGSSIPLEQISSGDLVLTSDGKKVWPAKVTRQWHSGVKDILKIILSSGTVIYSSQNHRFLTPEGDKFAHELKPALVMKNAHINGSALYEQWPTSRNTKKLQRGGAYILGLLLGDGDLTASTPNVACATEESAVWIANLIATTWGGEAKYYFNTRCWYAYAKFNTAPRTTPLTQFMNRLYGGRGWKVKSLEKHLPADILHYAEQDRIDLLRGLWDSDGSYNQQLLYLRSSSPKLLQGVGLLLGSLKISYSIASNYVLIADRTRFNLILGKAQLPGKPCQEIINNYLPIPSAAFAEVLVTSLSRTDRSTRSTVKRSLQKGTLFRPMESGYKANLDSWDDFYYQIYSTTYLQDARPVYVVSVEDWGTEDCFDLEMADQTSPYFLAQGVVTHNCYQEQIMKMAQDLAGYSLGQADLLRRAMGKKKVSEMQKHREIFIDGSAKNGVKPKIAEALFEQMVLFAEYCFNKSHSTAYGYVTYQTAYLKANYPVEYMAALLTANSGDQAKVQRYIATCLTMGIQVEPPNINRSGVDFTPLEASILFGLSAVRHVGQGAIEEILAARDGGEFQSLADLCDRVDSRVVNRRALEALIHSGGFDTLELNRNQLIHDLEPVIDWAQTRAKDRAVGQGNLFDLFGSSSSTKETSTFESAPKAPAVEDLPQNEKLRLEKELLGFYISDHPLKAVQQSAQILAPVNLLELEEQPENSLVSAIVLLTEVKPIVTKKGDRMAIVQLEDLTGKAEAVVFPKSFERIGAYITPDQRLMVWGKVDRRDDRVQLIIEDAEPVEEVRLVMVELTPHKAADIEEQYRLKTILLEQGGESDNAKFPVVAAIGNQYQRSFVRLGARFRVENDQAAVQALISAGFQARSSALTSQH